MAAISGFDPKHIIKVNPSLKDPIDNPHTDKQKQALVVAKVGAGSIASCVACKCLGFLPALCILGCGGALAISKACYDIEMSERKKMEDARAIAANRLAYEPREDKNVPIEINFFNMDQLKSIANVFFDKIYPKDPQSLDKPHFFVDYSTGLQGSKIEPNRQVRLFIKESVDEFLRQKDILKNEIYQNIEIKTYFEFLNFLNEFSRRDDRAIFFRKNNNFYAIYKKINRANKQEFWLFDMNLNVINGFYLQRFEEIRLLANYLHSIDDKYLNLEYAFKR